MSIEQQAKHSNHRPDDQMWIADGGAYRPMMERMSAAPSGDLRNPVHHTYSLTEAEVQEKFASVNLRAKQQYEACNLFMAGNIHLGPQWMASRTAVNSLAMLQVGFMHDDDSACR